MKNLAKIFMMVAALFAFACTTDVTEDLGVQLGDGAGQTTITLSLEESRTQLGEKAGDLYPLYWSEGDAIAANGFASNPIADEWVGKSGATFTFAENLSHPYHIVYPAPAEGVKAVTEGCYPVVFPAVQKYVAGNIDGAAAVMYGYAEEGSVPTLNHLTGILRFAVKGDVTLASMVVTAEKGALSGTYDVNCATGALTVQEGSTGNSVSVSFGEGLKLSAEEASLIHVAVPAGEYGIVSVMLNTVDDQHMYAKFNSDGDKKVNAGKVREFTGFTFEANSEVDTVIFEISDVATLKKFAELVATDKFYPRTEAKLVAPIDMTGVEWTPIDDFSYTFNGNNQTITGLTEPLFGTVSANIKDLTLANVNIASNGRLVLGAVACVLSAGDNSNISNCKVSGAITVSNPDTAIASDANLYTTVNYAGVVGTTYADVTNCVNEANITVNQIAKSDNAVVVHPSIGGIVGYNSDGGITNCVNGNEAKTTGAIKYLDNQKALIYIPHIGGVLGMGSTSNFNRFADNTNYGAIELNANVEGSNAIDYRSTTVGGVAGSSYHDIEDNNNYGTITVSGGILKTLYLGGIVGTTIPVKMYNCHNHQGANITVDSDVSTLCINVAGVVSGFQRNADRTNYLDGCTNDAPIHVKSSTPEDAPTGGGNYYRVGGIVTYTNNTIRNCENKENGDITIEGNITLLRPDKSQTGFSVVGVSCYHTSSGNISNLINRGDINIYANVAPHASWATSTSTDAQNYGHMDISGVVGYTTRARTDLQNYGNINIGRTTGENISIVGNGIFIGGLASYGGGALSKSAIDNNINAGSITINNATLNGASTPKIGTTNNPWGVHIGGNVAYRTAAISDTKNSGSITLNSGATISSPLHLGGVCGYANNNISNCENTGAIACNGTCSSTICMGGVVGYTSGDIESSNNNGPISTGKTATFVNYARISGVAGYSSKTITTAKNNANGDITIEGNFEAQTHFGGIVSYYHNVLTSCENHGDITFNATTATDKALYIAGLVGEYYTSDNDTIVGTFTDCINTGDVALNECTTSTGGILINIAGLAGYTRKATTFTNCSNSGTISTAKSININSEFSIGGLIGRADTTLTLDNCHNSMKTGKTYGIDIQHTIKADAGSNRARVGGLIGWHCGGIITTRNGVSNSADIYIGCINNESGGSSYGGIAGVLASNSHSLGGTVSNSGHIVYEGASPSGTFAIGGLFGQSGDKAPALCEDLRNTGDITIKSTHDKWKPTAKKHGYVGGIIGIHSVALSNAKFYGTITAIGFEDTHSTSYKNSVGGIVGSITSASLSNCHIGGTIVCTSETKEETDEEGYVTVVTTQTPGKLSVDNYAAYLSGDHTFTSAAAKSQSCGYISAIDATAEYAK